MLRIILGLVVGLALGIALVMLGETANHALFPPPADFDPTRPDNVRAYIESAPIQALAGLPLSWAIAAGVGAFATARISARAWPAWVVGAVLFGLTLLNLALIPHPWWMLVAVLVATPLAVWLGRTLGAAKPA